LDYFDKKGKLMIVQWAAS